MKYWKIYSCIFLLFCFSFQMNAESPASTKMEWWRDARFGMFIHWGVYAVPGNIYEGKNVAGDDVSFNKVGTGIPSEWIMAATQIPRTVYRQFADQFDAKDYNPQEWVALAKNAGMKYIVITAKHHDGFCLFETKHTDWNAVDASAAKKDLLKDLCAEAKKAGIKIGFYYSQNADWMHEGGMGDIPELQGKQYSSEQISNYVHELVIPQIKELLMNYEIDILWFDSGWANASTQLADEILNAVKEIDKDNRVILNDRLMSGYSGDFETQETDTPFIPYNGYSDHRDWEACSSMNRSWGYEDDTDATWKSSEYFISRLIELTSKGGNYLLNVGPDHHGNIVPRAQERLKEIGAWMDKNSESIYGTHENNLINSFEYGYVTQKQNSDNSIQFYLHIPSNSWPKDNLILLKGVMDKPSEAIMLGSKETLRTTLTNEGIQIKIPEIPESPYYSVISLHFNKEPQQIPISSDIIILNPFQATTRHLEKNDSPYTLIGWYTSDTEASWDIYIKNPGKYNIVAELSALYAGGDVLIQVNDQVYESPYPKNNLFDWNDFQTLSLTPISFNSGKYTLKMTRKVDAGVFNPIYLRKLTLTRDQSNSIPEVDIEKLKIYPIPANDFITIETGTPQNIEIRSISGTLLKKYRIENFQYINVSSFAPGTYLVKGEKDVVKIIIQ